ncbi:glycosyltransferase family 87 protein [Singulisphaera sp. Ch08]|uniref:Glycosyltransferase family 87 protein n=1 Tax=Singulisphaera sp. Ch08 TaxID=3120278 RepID=A0AAU7CCW1_9BACT
MTRRRLLAAMGLALFFTYVVLRSAQRGNDFKYPYLAAQALWRTSRLHVSAQPRYPVSFHVLLAPLAALPIGLASTVWAALSFTAVGALPRIFERLSGRNLHYQALAWFVVIPFFIDALVLGQSDPINVCLVALGLQVLLQGNAMVSVGLVGMAGMIKILPILHWATIVARVRTWRVGLAMLLTATLGLGVVVVAVGWSSALEAIREQIVWISNYEKPWHLVARHADLRVNNESLPIVLVRTFGDLGKDHPPHSLSLGILSLNLIWVLWGLVLAGLSVAWILCAWKTRAAEPRRATLGMFALSSIVMLASTPICWHHYFLWLLPAVIFLAQRRRLLWACGILSLVGTALPVARGLGCHMLMALGLFTVVAHDLLYRPAEPLILPGQSDTISPHRIERIPAGELPNVAATSRQAVGD